MLFGLNPDFIQSQYDELVKIISSDQNLDRNKRADIQKKVSVLQDILAILTRREELETEKVQYLEELSTLKDGDEFGELIKDEIKQVEEKMVEKEKELEEILFPPDTRFSRPCFVEIRAGAGGQEASIFANDLMKTYMAYAVSKNWQATVHSINTTDVGGVREVILYIKGKQAYGNLKFESGVHRVQRVPVTEAAGRIHTSTITVAVLPEADEVDVVISPNDIRVDTFRASGAGGQHVNTTDSAIRITHIPSGLVVSCQDERSQNKNKAKAMKELRSRMLESEIRKADAERSSERKSKIGSGDRAEKIRTYNYPQNRITDHRIELTLKKLDIIMAGNLDEIITALKTEDGENRSVPENLKFLFPTK